MALKTLVKVGEISNLSDARYCAGMGVEMLGFNLNPTSESYISLEVFNEITNWVAGVKFVGEFGSMEQDSILNTLHQYDLDFIEVNDSNAEVILRTDIPVIIKVGDVSRFRSIPANAAYYLIENTDVGSEDLADRPILVSGKISSQNLEPLLKNETIIGIALTGSQEDKPGFKDYDELADILEALEIDDSRDF